MRWVLQKVTKARSCMMEEKTVRKMKIKYCKLCDDQKFATPRGFQECATQQITLKLQHPGPCGEFPHRTMNESNRSCPAGHWRSFRDGPRSGGRVKRGCCLRAWRGVCGLTDGQLIMALQDVAELRLLNRRKGTSRQPANLRLLSQQLARKSR